MSADMALRLVAWLLLSIAAAVVIRVASDKVRVLWRKWRHRREQLPATLAQHNARRDAAELAEKEAINESQRLAARARERLAEASERKRDTTNRRTA